MERCVFVNYRGEDRASNGAWLYTELIHHLGEQRVFLDAESIPAGADFEQELLGPGAVGPNPAGGDRSPLAHRHEPRDRAAPDR